METISERIRQENAALRHALKDEEGFIVWKNVNSPFPGSQEHVETAGGLFIGSLEQMKASIEDGVFIDRDTIIDGRSGTVRIQKGACLRNAQVGPNVEIGAWATVLNADLSNGAPFNDPDSFVSGGPLREVPPKMVIEDWVQVINQQVVKSIPADKGLTDWRNHIAKVVDGSFFVPAPQIEDVALSK